MKKFKIKNLVNGLEFVVTGETLPELQPEWGSPEKEKVEMDSEGNIVSTTQVPAEYEVIEEEYDPEAGRQEAEALQYLASTDWYVVRFAETGVIVPIEILEARKLARERASA